MSDIAIKVENLSKLYQLGEVGTGTISHDLNRWWARVRGKEDPYTKIGQTNDRTIKAESDFVWALKDINFEVKQGEVLGIIGRNGAGKSTLLKILSKITSPTTGKIYTKGRIASLLEVGTGFHPEMTGRENIYLNGAILGMRKWEIDKKFDEIVDFAGVEAYIDTPVKRYSSGMYVRLAFAVAAFLEPEILIVDEVLAVGDAEFQKKCLGRMKDVSLNHGRTVLFVSHNLDAIVNICKSVALVDKGTLVSVGETDEIITEYSIYSENNFKNASTTYVNKISSKSIYLTFATLEQNGKNVSSIDNSKFGIRTIIRSETSMPFSIEFIVKNSRGIPIIFISSGLGQGITFSHKSNFFVEILTEVVLPFLAKGEYFIDIIIGYTGVEIVEKVENFLKFTIHNGYVSNTSFVFNDKYGLGNILLYRNDEVSFKTVKYEAIN
jgi:lipopolysaccharide transport system ATP-binding protein